MPHNPQTGNEAIEGFLENPPKKGTGSVFPDGAVLAKAGQPRVEAFLTSDLFKSRFWFGLPLVSPITGEKVTPEMLNDYIHRGANQVEMDAKVDIFPVARRHRLPFDPNMYQQYIYVEVPNKPIQKVLRLAICSASYFTVSNSAWQEPNPLAPGAPGNLNPMYPSGAQIYPIPNDWIEMGNARKGRLNVIPINPAFTAISSSDSVTGTGSAILAFIGQLGWVPAYWTVECVQGFCSEDGHIPQIVNEAIGLAAAIKLIDAILPLYGIVSQSLGLDGLSQSNSNMMYQLLIQKRNYFKEEYLALVEKIKAYVGAKLFSSSV